MAKNTNTVAVATEQFVVDAARSAYSLLKRSKGLRPQAAMAFLNADTDAERQDVVDLWGAGFVRRALREAGVAFDRKGEAETANAFWTLRDSIDEQAGEFLVFADGDVEGDDEV